MRPGRAFLLLAVLAACMLCAGMVQGQSAERRSLLLFPIQAHWLSEPLADAVTAELSDQLSAAGLSVAEVHPDDPMVRLAAMEGWVDEKTIESGDLERAAQPLAVAAGAGAYLSGDLAESGSEVSVALEVAATVSQQSASFEVTVPAGERGRVAEQVAAEVAKTLTPQLWSVIGANAEGSRAAARRRYAAGREAMAEGMYRAALLEFEAALLGEFDNPAYLRATADARVELGDASGALARIRSLARLAPTNSEATLRLGELALAAGEPDQARAAFLAAQELLPDDPRVVEGLGRAARARGDYQLAEGYYRTLFTMLPQLEGAPSWLPSALAHRSDDAVRFSEVAPEEIGRQLARLYLAEGMIADGVAALLGYHSGEERPAYGDDEYVVIAEALDAELESISRDARAVPAGRGLEAAGLEEADAEMERLHDRSDALATLVERMEVTSRLEPAHRYRVLAYNFLNQANFEALIFLRTNDDERRRRADLLRTASRKALAQAELLEEGLMRVETAP